ncbi:MAG: sulfotransferase [Phycisphaeraceae bacterium]
MAQLLPPILVTGAMRSGKTTVARLISQNCDLTHWEEPNALWRMGHAYRRHDLATEADARPWVIWRVRRALVDYQRAHGNRRLVMCSPLVAMKLPMVLRILPEARILHMVRDGRSAIQDMLGLHTLESKYYHFADTGARKRMRAQLRLTPWHELPARIPGVLSGLTRRYFGRRPPRWIGIRYPGWRRDLDNLSPVQVAGKQWAITVQTCISGLTQVPCSRWVQVRIEDLNAEPLPWFAKIAHALDLPMSQAAIVGLADSVHRLPMAAKTLDRPVVEIDGALPILQPVLHTLGYL